jgi:hypothetical protein
MADGRGKAESLTIDENRLEDEDVGQVHPTFERVVHQEDIAGRHVAAEPLQDGLEGGRDRTQVTRQGQALRDQPPVAISERRRVVHVVLQNPRIGGPRDGQSHVVGDRQDGVLKEFERDRIVGCHRLGLFYLVSLLGH